MKRILNALEIDQKLEELAEAIIQRNRLEKELVLLGIERRGVPLARRLAEKIAGKTTMKVRIGVLDITLYGEAHRLIAKYPVLNGTDVSFPVDDRCVVIVDDILYTGKTIITAMQEVLHMGRPAEIQFAVFIDHGRRTFPVCADYTGIKMPVQPMERVVLRLAEIDEGEDAVFLIPRNETERG